MDPVSSSTDLSLSTEAIDPGVIAGLRELDDGGGELLGELITLFLADSPPRIEAVREAIAGNDATGVVRAAHALKSSAANLGAQNVAMLCQRLESVGRSGQLGGAGELFQRLEHEFAVARAILESQRQAEA